MPEAATAVIARLMIRRRLENERRSDDMDVGRIILELREEHKKSSRASRL
jgi:hypothetical protein